MRQDKPQIEYFVRSKAFLAQFPNVSDSQVWAWKCGYCRSKATGPLGSTEITIEDVNGVSHAFVIESFSVKHHVLTMGRWLRRVPAAVSVDVPGLAEQLAGA